MTETADKDESKLDKFVLSEELREYGVPFTIIRINQLIKVEAFPEPFKIGRRNAWLESDLLEWRRQRIATKGVRNTNPAKDTSKATAASVAARRRLAA